MSIYSIKSMGPVEEYIMLDEDFGYIQRYCRHSKIQFLDEELVKINASDKGGIEFPDLIVKGDVFIF